MGSPCLIMRAAVLLTIVAVATGAPKFSKKALSTPAEEAEGLLEELKLMLENSPTRLLCCVEVLEGLWSRITWWSLLGIAVMDKVPAGSESVLETITSIKMILIRKTLLLPRSCSMNNMTPGPSPMTSVFLNLRAQLILAALSLTRSCFHLTGRNTLLEPPALSLDGEPPLRVAALPKS